MKMLNKSKIKAWLIAPIFLFIFAGFFTGKDDVYFQIEKSIDLFGRIYKEVTFNYVDNIDPQEFMLAGIKGMLGALDPYTIFIDGNNKEDFDLITNGKYGGVGISIGVRGDLVTVVEVFDGYSAQKQGVRVGDNLIEVGGKKITPENVNEISSLVKGAPGTIINIKEFRDNKKDTLSFNLVREEVIVKSLAYAGFYPKNSNNVYMRLTNFSRSASDEVITALKKLKAEKEIKSVVLDLRGNPGGLLDVAVNICENFLKNHQLIVSTKGREEDSKKSYFSDQEPLLGDSRLAILIDGGSASASEIVAGAIQDHDRGVILGTKSFGKGLVQTITPLDFNTSLKITTAKYYTPSGRCIQKIDYANHNKAIVEVDTVVKNKFFTDNKRDVFSAGGITPDSTIPYIEEGDITKDLLAKGLFFQFADYYYYANAKDDFYSINGQKVFDDFRIYLNKQKYIYKSPEEEDVNKLLALVKSKNFNNTIYGNLEKVKSEFKNIGENDLLKYQKEITDEIKIELASRYLGNDGEIEEILSDDIQFKSALNILNNTKIYNYLLRNNNK